jgi:hypothetical protein
MRNNPNVVVAKINAAENEVPLILQQYPTFLFYKGNEKVKKFMEFKSKSD